MIDHFKENKNLRHSYLFKGITYQHAKAWRDTLPANRKRGFAEAVNSVNEKPVLRP